MNKLCNLRKNNVKEALRRNEIEEKDFIISFIIIIYSNVIFSMYGIYG